LAAAVSLKAAAWPQSGPDTGTCEVNRPFYASGIAEFAALLAAHSICGKKSFSAIILRCIFQIARIYSAENWAHGFSE
jgi:hypothetical protein